MPSFLAMLARGDLGILVLHLDDAVEQFGVQHGRHETRTDPLDGVARPGLPPDRPGRPPVSTAGKEGTASRFPQPPATPVMVPPLPTPATNASRSGISSRISRQCLVVDLGDWRCCRTAGA
jgi:hypothetical protein